jgi:NodT family efflux transporter outer membrane factor (OMF) lipoprotein
MNAVGIKRVVGVAGLAVALGAAGCKVGPNYERPQTGAPDAFANLGTGNTPSGSDATKSVEAFWWKGLGDPKLNELIEQSIATNLDLKLAIARIREARALRGFVDADRFPMVDAQGSYSRERRSPNAGQFSTDGRNESLFTVGFDASWELDFFGRIARSVEAADYDIESAIDNRRDVVVTLVSDIARNYVELRGFQQRLGIAVKNIQTQQQSVEITRSRFTAGLTTDLDVAQAEAILASTRSTVPTLEAGARRSMHRLSVLLGREPGALIADLDQAQTIPTVPQVVPVGVPSELLRRRPDVRRAERDLAAATARIGVATGDLFPRFSLTGSFGLQSDKIADLGDASSRFWSVGPAVRWPILDWYKIRSNINVQEARTEQALVRYEQSLLGSFEDVENALVSYSREQVRRASLADSVAASRRALDLSQQLYSTGLADFQRVLDSQRTLFAAEDQLVDSERQVSSNYVALCKALGGGWEGVEGVRAEDVDADREQRRNDPKPWPPASSHLTKSK